MWIMDFHFKLAVFGIWKKKSRIFYVFWEKKNTKNIYVNRTIWLNGDKNTNVKFKTKKKPFQWKLIFPDGFTFCCSSFDVHINWLIFVTSVKFVTLTWKWITLNTLCAIDTFINISSMVFYCIRYVFIINPYCWPFDSFCYVNK